MRWTDDLSQFAQRSTTTTNSNNKDTNDNNTNDDDNDNTTDNNNHDDEDGCDQMDNNDAMHDDGIGWLTLAVDLPKWQELEEQFVYRTLNGENLCSAAENRH